MKRNFFRTIFSSGRKYIVAALLLVSVSSFAADPADVNEKATSHFAAQFKNATNVSWTETDLYSEVTFDWLSEKMNAYYDNDGNFYCLSKEINSSSLPENALKNINEKFAGGVITQAIEMDKPDSTTEYYVSLETEKASLILSANEKGNVSVFKKTSR